MRAGIDVAGAIASCARSIGVRAGTVGSSASAGAMSATSIYGFGLDAACYLSINSNPLTKATARDIARAVTSSTGSVSVGASTVLRGAGACAVGSAVVYIDVRPVSLHWLEIDGVSDAYQDRCQREGLACWPSSSHGDQR